MKYGFGRKWQTIGLSVFVVSALLLCIVPATMAGAVMTYLPLRFEPGACTLSQQTIETNYGTSAHSLALTGSTIFEFYSPPIISAPALTTSDKSEGELWITNGSSQVFNATVRFSFFDYNPATGTESLVADTGASALTAIASYGSTLVTAPHPHLTSNSTPAAGHLLHIRVTVVVSGTVNNSAVLVNQPDGSAGFLPQHRTASWVFAPLSSPPDATITAPSSVAANSVGNAASVPLSAGAAYLWSIGNGTITAGQGTAQIAWTAGTSGSVNLGVTVTKGCSSSGSSIAAIYSPAPAISQIVSIAHPANSPAHITGTGQAGVTYTIQASTDLVTWQNIGTATAAGTSLFAFDDPDAGNFAVRFYRAATP